MQLESSPVRIAGDTEQVRVEIDALESDIHRYRSGALPEHVFVEKRLRHGVYGQRQDGVHMLRSKLPLGLISTEQLSAFADIAEVYGHGVAHLTTRQDIQVHFVALERSPGLLRALDAADMTSREACGNVVRNVTCAENAGISGLEPFDPTGHALALARYLLRHPEGQSLGRKFKIHVSGESDLRWDRGRFHDLGLVAKEQDGRRGWEVRVGGGLGAVPHQAPILDAFVPEDELHAVVNAILVVFGRHGEKKNRARARLKFLVADWGIARFAEAVAAARVPVPFDGPEPFEEKVRHPPGGEIPAPRSPDEARWQAENLLPQRQAGYRAVWVRVPRGDLSPEQLRALARLLAAEVGETTRITADQGLAVRHVSTDRLPALYDGLRGLGLAGAGAAGIADPVTCPGADTCKLGITSPRAIAKKIAPELDALAEDPALRSLNVRISGCPNACAQHHVGDLGFFGAARTVEGVTAPHYIVMLGGEPGGSAYGTAHGKVPAARLGEAIGALGRTWLAERDGDEGFGAWVRRAGRDRFKQLLEPFGELPPIDVDPAAWREPGSEEAFRIVRGTGECAGMIVDEADFWLADADRDAESAADALARGEDPLPAARRAFLLSARALLATDGVRPTTDAGVIDAFRTGFYDAGRIFEGVGYYLLSAFDVAEGDRVRRLVEESRLFVEEAHGILARLRAPARKVPARGPVEAP
jgi:sulfite reductase (ferredoxin)